MITPEQGRVKPQEILGPDNYPLGVAILNHGFLSEKGPTENNILEIRKLIKTKGVVFLNDHRDWFGIVVAAAHLLEHIRIDTIKGPGALTILEGIMYRLPLKYIRSHPGIEAMPVARKEELEKAMRKGKFKGRTLDQLNQLNEEYLQRVRNIKHEPNTASMIALFGSRNTYGKREKVRRGVVEILQSGVVYVPTFSERVDNGTFLPSYEIHVGEPATFSIGEHPELIRRTLVRKYFDLEKFVASL